MKIRDKESFILFVIGIGLSFFVVLNGYHLLNAWVNQMLKKTNESGFQNCITLEIYSSERKKDESVTYISDNVGSVDEGLKLQEECLSIAEEVLNALEKQDKVVYIQDIYLPVGEASEEQPVNVVLAGEEEWYRTLQSGTYPTKTQWWQNGGVAIINENARKYVEIIDGQELIRVDGEEYLVNGIFEEYQAVDTEIEIVIYHSSLKERDVIHQMLAKAFENGFERRICIGSNVQDVKEDGERIKAELELIEGCSVNVLEYNANETNGLFYVKLKGTILVILFIISLINCWQIVKLWIVRKRKDMVILKAFGMSNMRIMRFLLSELLLMIASSVFIVCLLELIYNAITRNVEMDWQIMVRNSGMLIVAFAVIVGVAVWAAMLQLQTIMPAQGMKGD